MNLKVTNKVKAAQNNLKKKSSSSQGTRKKQAKRRSKKKSSKKRASKKWKNRSLRCIHRKVLGHSSNFSKDRQGTRKRATTICKVMGRAWIRAKTKRRCQVLIMMALI